MLSNRSAAWHALGEKQLALDDAARVVELKPEWYKGYGRLGAALASLERTTDAIHAYEQGLKHNAESSVLQAELKRLKELLKREASPTGAVALTGIALAKECNRLGRPEQAVRELDKLMTNKVNDAELYCERSLANNNCHQLANAVEDAKTAGTPHHASNPTLSQPRASPDSPLLERWCG